MYIYGGYFSGIFVSSRQLIPERPRNFRFPRDKTRKVDVLCKNELQSSENVDETNFFNVFFALFY